MGCVTSTNPTFFFRFVSATPTPWYVQGRLFIGPNASNPPYPAAGVSVGQNGTPTWAVGIDVTYHYTPNSVSVQAATWAATKAIYR
jgi:hypothetical protein